MNAIPSDETFMRHAIELAAQGEGSVEPNPMVGCVLVKNDAIIGQGYHQNFGGPHAEVNAIVSLASPADAAGATAYVTLEPCCHQGKTPPCTRALIDAGIARVVVAMQDPFGKVNGGGIQQLREAGKDVTVGVLQAEAEQLTAPFTKRVRTGRPWVIAKWAMTVDGRIATTTGESQWISGQASRREVHQLRSRVDAIAIGMGTVTADDPMLNARLPDGAAAKREAVRVVYCKHRLPSPESKLVRTANQLPTLIVASSSIAKSDLSALAQTGVHTLHLDVDDSSEMVTASLDHLGKLAGRRPSSHASSGVNGATNVMIEGGSELLSSFFSAGEVDEIHLYIGAKVFGGKAAPGPIGGLGVQQISQAWQFRLIQTDQFDDDVRLIYRRR